MRYFDIVQSSCIDDKAVVVNHEPMRQSDVYETMEVLRRSYQFMGYEIIHDVTGFIVADKGQWFTRFSKEGHKDK